MKCVTCGFENPDGLDFCQSCGSSLEIIPTQRAVLKNEQTSASRQVSQTQPQKTSASEQRRGAVAKVPKKTKSGGFLKIGLASVFVVFVIVFLAVALFGGDKYDMRENNYISFYEKNEGRSIILYNNKEIKDKVEGNIRGFQTNYNSTFAAFIASLEKDKPSDEDMSADGTVNKAAKGTLYALTKNKLTVIEEGVTEIFAVAESGKVLAYENGEGVLYFYKNGKSIKVAEKADNVIISSDGKSMVYRTANEEDTALYYFDGKNSRKIGKNITAEALSDGGRYIYYTKDDGDLYVTSAKKPEKSEKIASSDSGKTPVISVTNKNRTQIIYSLGDKSFFINKGNVEKKVKVANTSSMRLFAPKGAAGKTDDLRKQFYIGDNGDLYYVNKKAESEKIASSLSDHQMSENGKTIYYSKGEDLYILKTNKLKDAERISRNAYDFEMLSNGKAAYYIDSSDNLYYIRGKGEPKLVSDDASRLAVAHDGIAFFLKAVDGEKGDGTLYYSKNGGKEKKIVDDVFGIKATPFATYYMTNYDQKDFSFDFYLTKGGTKFKAVSKGASGK